ncbi:MAG: hypothetical protein Q4C29_03930 [bacterium]|nr:hypothetical protein [bacterium]
MTKGSKKYEMLFEYGKLFAKTNTRSYISLKNEIISKYGDKAAEVFELGVCSMVDTYLEVYSRCSDNELLKELAIGGNLHSWNEETGSINEDYIKDAKTLKRNK